MKTFLYSAATIVGLLIVMVLIVLLLSWMYRNGITPP